MKTLRDIAPDAAVLLDGPFLLASEPTLQCLRQIQRLLAPAGVVAYEHGLRFESDRGSAECVRDVFKPLREAIRFKQQRAECLVWTELIPRLNADLEDARLALAMSGHARLGQSSLLCVLDPEIVREIARVAGLFWLV